MYNNQLHNVSITNRSMCIEKEQNCDRWRRRKWNVEHILYRCWCTIDIHPYLLSTSTHLYLLTTNTGQ